jgi:hypothetical protein
MAHSAHGATRRRAYTHNRTHAALRDSGYSSIGLLSLHQNAFARATSEKERNYAGHIRNGRERILSKPISIRKMLVSFQSMTSVARASTLRGTLRPRSFAALRLRAISYRVGACTGRSAGLAPLRMRST